MERTEKYLTSGLLLLGVFGTLVFGYECCNAPPSKEAPTDDPFADTASDSPPDSASFCGNSQIIDQ
jgi:hypothetical protein